LVGGPGFEPGASRSRNLGRLVHRDGFRRIWAHFDDSADSFKPLSAIRALWITTWTT